MDAASSDAGDQRSRVTRGGLIRVLAIIGAICIGVLTAAQARVNGALGVELGDGLLAALISFTVGLFIVVTLSVVLPSGRAGARALAAGIAERTIPWWMLLGGAAGALTVATQGLTVAVIGVALFSVGIVAGQTINSLVLDRVGYGPTGIVAVTPGRVVGALLALVAVAPSISPELLATVPAWMLVLPVLAGAGIAWQQATNGRLRHRVGTALTATLVNFIGGTTLLAIAAGVHIAIVGAPSALPTEPWLYLGGAMGMVYILMSASIVRFTGVLLLGLASIVGQLFASVALDALWPATAGAGLGQALLMVALALLAVLAAGVPWGRVRWSGVIGR